MKCISIKESISTG